MLKTIINCRAKKGLSLFVVIIMLMSTIIFIAPIQVSAADIYEAESGTLAGGATISSDSFASGGQKVGSMHLGGASITKTGINGGTGGSVTLKIRYAAGGAATKSLYVNGVDVQQLSFPATGAWGGSEGAYTEITTTVTLNSGTSNTIMIRNDAADADGVDIDKLTVDATSSATYEAESATLANGATISSDSFASGGQKVGQMHNGNASIAVNNVNGGTGGSQTLKIRYAAGGSATKSLYVNGIDVQQITFPATGAWGGSAAAYTEVTTDVTLNSGTNNTIMIRNDAADADGVDIDKLTIGTSSPTPSGAKLDYYYSGSELILPGIDKTNPFVYDNDMFSDTCDLYYFAALAELNGGSMKAIVATYDMWTSYPFSDQYNDAVTQVNRFRNSNMSTIPDPVYGSASRLNRPGSGNIADTSYTITAGSTAIVNAANTYGTPSKPLIIAIGGQPTTVATAYLQDPSIADKVVVFHIDPLGYNGLDSWATYICAKQMKFVAWGDMLWWWTGTPQNPVIVSNPPILQDSAFLALPNNTACNYLKNSYMPSQVNQIYHDIGDGALGCYLQDRTQFPTVQKRNASYSGGCQFSNTSNTTFDVLSISYMSDNKRNLGNAFFQVVGNPQAYN